MTVWLLISALLNPMQSMMGVVLSATRSDWWHFRISTEGYNILHFIVYKRFVLFINQAWILFAGRHEDTMVVRVESYRNLLSREDSQWLSRVCCLLYVDR